PTRVVRSPNLSTSRPPNGPNTNRINANAETTAPAAVVPTPNAWVNSGMAGVRMPKPRATENATPASARMSRGTERSVDDDGKRTFVHAATGRQEARARTGAARRVRTAGHLHGGPSGEARNDLLGEQME